MALVLLLLGVLHFGLRPFAGGAFLQHVAPDFLLLALLVYAIRARPGQGAIAGFLVGLLADSLSPAAFGAGALSHTVIGYFAAWGKAVFFADNLFVNAVFFFVGAWARDVLVLVVGRHAEGSALLWQLFYWSPLSALTTSLAGVVVLLVFRNWLHIRIRE
ncbi:MAG: rod shape-determining protein MreD [Gemmatimonadales bacterium]